MIFARRALQRRLAELRTVLGDASVDALAVRLNRPGRDRTAAMWEVVVLHGLSASGRLLNEAALSSGRRPDIRFEGERLQLTTDVVSVSDDGLDDQNPYFELSELLERAKTKLGLPPGGLDVQVRSKHERVRRGTRTVLRLPPRRDLQRFVRDDIMPQLREQRLRGEAILRISIDDDIAGIDVTIDPARSPYSSGGFAAYDVPGILDRNPLYNALKEKADQLRAATGLKGVVVGDAGCAALSDRRLGRNDVAAEAIAREFLRQHSSIDFVLLLSVRETGGLSGTGTSPDHRMHMRLVVRSVGSTEDELDRLFRSMLTEFPRPIATPANGALRACEPGYDLGHHGGYRVSGNRIRIGSRELIEILAGRRTLEDEGGRPSKGRGDRPRRENRVQATFERLLAEGRLPRTVTVLRTDEDGDDDWVEFDFGDPDPAITPLQ